MVKEDEAAQYSRIEAGIAEAVKFLPKNFSARHEHSRRCYRVLKHILHPDEYTVIEAKQSKLKVFAPARIVATNQRLIVVRPSFWSLYAGRNIFSPTRYVSIPYSNIINITLYTGLILSTLDINLSVSTNIGGEIEGLKTEDARAIFAFLEKLTEYIRKNAEKPSSNLDVSFGYSESKKAIGLNYINIDTAKSLIKNAGAKLVWLGIEPLDYVVQSLGISGGSIIKSGIKELSDMDEEKIKELEGDVFLCYDGKFSTHVSKFLKSNYKVNSYILIGGIEEQMKRLSGSLKNH